MSIDHWMMFSTFAEQNRFEFPSPGTYTGVIINGNMAAHAPNGLAGFLLTKTVERKYIIDPLTHAFQHRPDMVCTKNTDGERVPKRALKALADILGEPISSSLGVRSIVPDDLKGSVL